MILTQRADYTFKYNAGLGRHGWLRLTPAYSVKLVREILNSFPGNAVILDPFSGTATTGVVAAECGYSAHCMDINPFLVWLGNVKSRNYTAGDLRRLKNTADKILACGRTLSAGGNWRPPMHNITRWWGEETLSILSALRQSLAERLGEPACNASAPAWVAFCRLAIETSAAAFNHVSMSFHDTKAVYTVAQIQELYSAILGAVIESCRIPLNGNVLVTLADTTNLSAAEDKRYSHVVTSPPYPNRMSYIRELRPYMYWTKMLESAKSASELDWQAIGGTWGTATSRLQHWQPREGALPSALHAVVDEILRVNNKNSPLMANYVWKYFSDMARHIQTLKPLLQKNAELFYIVGNSSFYGVAVETQKLLADIFLAAGFSAPGIKILRKRNSKKELLEFCVHTSLQNSKHAQTFCHASPLNMKDKQLSLWG